MSTLNLFKVRQGFGINTKGGTVGVVRHIDVLDVDNIALINADPVRTLYMLPANLIGTGPAGLYVKRTDTDVPADDLEPYLTEADVLAAVPEYARPKSQRSTIGAGDINTWKTAHAGVKVAAVSSVTFNVSVQAGSASVVYQVMSGKNNADAFTDPTILVLSGNDHAAQFRIVVAAGVASLEINDPLEATVDAATVAWTGTSSTDLLQADLYP